MRLWTNGQVIISAKDDKDRDLLISELGLDPYVPPADKTFNDIIKILEKAYPNLMVGLMGSWHELWDQETLLTEKGSFNIEKIKKDKRGKFADLEGDKWKLTEMLNGI
jgi:hypothetical protein